MRLIDIVNRAATPAPWAEGEKIHWNDPGFSARMLREHLSQAHDAASRRFPTIDRQVAWIQGHVLNGQPTLVLDLGCGPGFYTSRLARLGHTYVGIDFGPASIAHAKAEAERDGLPCAYQLADIREADFGEGYGLVMLIYGEMNVFRPRDIRQILRRAARALAPGGILLLEPQSLTGIEREATSGASWYAVPSGLFSDGPHIVLTENHWDAERVVGTTRHIAIDAVSTDVSWHAMSNQAYTTEGFCGLLAECGYADVTFYPSLTGEVVDDDGLVVIVARTEGDGVV